MPHKTDKKTSRKVLKPAPVNRGRNIQIRLSPTELAVAEAVRESASATTMVPLKMGAVAKAALLNAERSRTMESRLRNVISMMHSAQPATSYSALEIRNMLQAILDGAS